MDAHLLLIDDDHRLSELLGEYFQSFGWQLATHARGDGVLEVLQSQEPDLIILDMMLPGKDGLEVLREIRSITNLPVLMLTARGEEADRIAGLELGADDYLPKPFNPRELHARIKAILRRVQNSASSENAFLQQNIVTAGTVIQYAGLHLISARRSMKVGTQMIELSEASYRLMEVFIKNHARVLDRDQIMNLTRGRDSIAFERSIDVQVSKLRQILTEHKGHRARIKTIWGRGYMLLEDAEK